MKSDTTDAYLENEILSLHSVHYIQSIYNSFELSFL